MSASMSDELQRQININLQLRRKLEASRRDVVEYCAKFCEDHEAGMGYRGELGWSVTARLTALGGSHPGDAYAQGLRAIISKGE